MSLDIESLTSYSTEGVGFFRFKKFDTESYLITNDFWRYHFLSNSDFELFITWRYQEINEQKDLRAKGFILTEDYQEKMIWSMAMKNHFIGKWPTLHMIVTTLRCNHHCKYCHAAVAPMSAKEFDMTEETARKVVDAIFYTNNDSLTIEFQWGESLVNYPIVQFIVEYAWIKAQHLKKQLTFSMVTNLTLMTDDKLEWLMERGVDICTSLDGDEWNHNNNRTGYDGNSFEKVSYWIQKINKKREEKGLGKMGVLLTVTKENIANYKEIIDTYIQLGINGIFLRWLNPYGFAAADIKNLAYTSEEWIDFYRKSLDYIIELNQKWIYFQEYITKVFLQKIFQPYDPAFMDIRSPSGIAVGGVAYNYDWKIYASDESRMLGRMGIDDFLMTDMQEDGEKTYRAMMTSEIVKIAVQSSCLDGLPGYNQHVYKPYLWVDIIHNFKVSWNVFFPMMRDEKVKMQIGILDTIFQKIRNPEVKEIFKKWL